MNKPDIKKVNMLWNIFLTFIAVILFYLTVQKDIKITDSSFSTVSVFLAIAFISFLSEYTDSALGMGFGTILTPVLLILGFSPLQVVPCLLISETLSGLFAGAFHHALGNVNLKKGSEDNVAMKILASCSILGTLFAVYCAVSLPKEMVKTYIAVMIIAIAIFLMLGNRLSLKYSRKKMVFLGLVAAFNKGISGGGYGPLVTGGQVIIGVEEKKAIGITSFAEGLVCLVGVLSYLYFKTTDIDLFLAVPLCTGALLSVPLAAFTVKVVPPEIVRAKIGYATLYLGILCFVKLFI
ncbi:MAG: sulfite exporter TauE/SafE family protein [Alphaproteobacteria bacterium]